MLKEGSKSTHAALKQVRRSTAIWISSLVGCGAAIFSALIVAAIDRPHRAPVGAWVSEFVKSPGLAGVCALVAASLALWGIFTQVAVARRSLDHQREVDEHRAWWERFEWTAARAVPRSKDEVPMPYAAVLSTLTALTETAADNVQRTAVGAITEVSAQTQQRLQENSDPAADQSPRASEQTMDALKNYSEAAGDSPARSAAIDEQLYELQVIEALRRILPSDSVDTQALYRDGPNLRAVRPDATVRYKGKQIIVEVKSYREQQSLPSAATSQMLSMVKTTGADAAILVTPVEMHANLLDRHSDMIAVAWTSAQDDGKLLTAIDRVVS